MRKCSALCTSRPLLPLVRINLNNFEKNRFWQIFLFNGGARKNIWLARWNFYSLHHHLDSRMPAERDAQLFQRQKNMLGLMALNASGILCHLFLAPATSGISSFLKVSFYSIKNQVFCFEPLFWDFKKL